MPSLRKLDTAKQRRRVRHARIVALLRDDVFSRDDFRCVYCGRGASIRPIKGGLTMRVDHMTPISRDGTSTMGNLASACSECDTLKGDMTAEEFRALPRSKSPIRGRSRP